MNHRSADNHGAVWLMEATGINALDESFISDSFNGLRYFLERGPKGERGLPFLRQVIFPDQVVLREAMGFIPACFPFIHNRILGSENIEQTLYLLAGRAKGGGQTRNVELLKLLLLSDHARHGRVEMVETLAAQHFSQRVEAELDMVAGYAGPYSRSYTLSYADVVALGMAPDPQGFVHDFVESYTKTRQKSRAITAGEAYLFGLISKETLVSLPKKGKEILTRDVLEANPVLPQEPVTFEALLQTGRLSEADIFERVAYGRKVTVGDLVDRGVWTPEQVMVFAHIIHFSDGAEIPRVRLDWLQEQGFFTKNGKAVHDAFAACDRGFRNEATGRGASLSEWVAYGLIPFQEIPEVLEKLAVSVDSRKRGKLEMLWPENQRRAFYDRYNVLNKQQFITDLHPTLGQCADAMLTGQTGAGYLADIHRQRFEAMIMGGAAPYEKAYSTAAVNGLITARELFRIGYNVGTLEKTGTDMQGRDIYETRNRQVQLIMDVQDFEASIVRIPQTGVQTGLGKAVLNFGALQDAWRLKPDEAEILQNLNITWKKNVIELPLRDLMQLARLSLAHHTREDSRKFYRVLDAVLYGAPPLALRAAAMEALSCDQNGRKIFQNQEQAALLHQIELDFAEEHFRLQNAILGENPHAPYTPYMALKANIMLDQHNLGEIALTEAAHHSRFLWDKLFVPNHDKALVKIIDERGIPADLMRNRVDYFVTMRRLAHMVQDGAGNPLSNINSYYQSESLPLKRSFVAAVLSANDTIELIMERKALERSPLPDRKERIQRVDLAIYNSIMDAIDRESAAFPFVAKLFADKELVKSTIKTIYECLTPGRDADRCRQGSPWVAYIASRENPGPGVHPPF